MSKSYNFCKALCHDKERCGFYDRKWDDVSEYSFIDVFKNKLPLHHTLKSDNVKISIDVIYDPSADFQYFTSYVAQTDGTMIFELKAMQEIFSRLAQCGTYFNKMDAPHNGAHISYTVGNFIVVREYNKEISLPEKPWMSERLTVMLPIKYEIRDREKSDDEK